MKCFICAGKRHPLQDPNKNKTQLTEKELANAIRYLVECVYPVSSNDVASTCSTCIALFKEMHRIMCEKKNLTNILNRLVALKYGLVDFTKPRIRVDMDDIASKSFYPPNPKTDERKCRKCSFVVQSAAAVTAHYKFHLLMEVEGKRSSDSISVEIRRQHISKTTQTTPLKQTEVIGIDCESECSEDVADENLFNNDNAAAYLVPNTDYSEDFLNDDMEIEQVNIEDFTSTLNSSGHHFGHVKIEPIDENPNPLAIQLEIVPAFSDISKKFPFASSQQYDHDYCEKLNTSSPDEFDSDSDYENYMNNINSRIEILKCQREHIESAKNTDYMDILLNTQISLSQLTPERVELKLVSLFSRESGIVRYNCSKCKYVCLKV